MNIEEYHDQLFGKGSWKELERGVAKRRPDIWQLIVDREMQDLDDAEYQANRKWWQFWKPRYRSK